MAPQHKRKRSLQTASVDISKMKKAMEALKDALMEELEGVEETEDEMSSIMDHVAKLDEILNSAKLPVCNPLC